MEIRFEGSKVRFSQKTMTVRKSFLDRKYFVLHIYAKN